MQLQMRERGLPDPRFFGIENEHAATHKNDKKASATSAFALESYVAKVALSAC
jgi:hypothetical protein